MTDRTRPDGKRQALAVAVLASLAVVAGPARAQAPDGATQRPPQAAPAVPSPAMPGASAPVPTSPAAPGMTEPSPGARAPDDGHPHGRMPSHPGAGPAGQGHDHAPGPRAQRPRAGDSPESRQERMMGRLDTDGDGAVSRAEFEAAQRAMNAMFERADTDRDGRLTRDELRAWRERMQSRRSDRPGDATPRAMPGAGTQPPAENELGRGTTG